MLQCWMQDRFKRPRFVDIVNLLEKLLRNPESLSAIASIDPRYEPLARTVALRIRSLALFFN